MPRVPQFTTGVFSQTLWRGVGDIDDCWCLADMAGVHGCAPWSVLPGVKAYRAAAGDPDDGVSDAGTIAESAKAIRALWPDLAITVCKATPLAAFYAAVKGGRCASVSVWSGAMPIAQRYGFERGHRITVYWNGTTFRAVNPLAKAHSLGDEITEAQLTKAILAYDSKGVWAILFPTVDAAFKTHPLYVDPAPPPDCSAEVAAAVAPLNAKIEAGRKALA